MLNKVIIEKSPINPPAAVLNPGTAAHFAPHFSQAKSETLRKSIHFLIAFSPLMAAANFNFTVLALSAGILSYTAMELARLSGIHIPLVSAVTRLAGRPRERNRFTLGPVTLGLGALLTLLIFPLSAASIGIYALAFGDGLAGLAGRLFGRIRPAFLFGKSVEGAAACFTAVFVSAWLVSRSVSVSLTAALTAAVVEALPLEDYDNIVLPLAVGLAVMLAVQHAG